jgi:1,4-dihydroxy-6-naphthoate synthase
MLKTKTIKIAHSPDSDDAFMFYAIQAKKIDLQGLDFEISSEEIGKLNEYALNPHTSPIDANIYAVSFHAYAYLADSYQILPSGASMAGKNYGPRLICKPVNLVPELFSKEGAAQRLSMFGLGQGICERATGVNPSVNEDGERTNNAEISQTQTVCKVAVPGRLTSAYLCLQIYAHEQNLEFEPIFCSFNEVFSLLESGEVDASLLIHESQLKYEENNCELMVDLGAWWQDYTKAKLGKPLSMPLGCNVIKRSLGAETIQKISNLLEASIRYGLANFDEALKYARNFANNGLSDEAARRYINMYVNEHSLSLQEDDIESINFMFKRAQDLSFIPIRPQIAPLTE